MLLLGSKSIVVDGIQVFTDHADPNQFWYLPAPVAIARKPDGSAAFTFIKYKPAAVAAGAKGGGFVMFDTALHVDSSTEQRILSKLAALGAPTDQARIAPVQFDSGTVKCVALNLQGDGGTFATPAPPGTFNAVEKIQGASVPSLAGDNNAIFSLQLSQEGAIILEQAFEQGTAPIGVIYDLRYTGIRPALDVKITVDFKRVYDSFSASITGQYMFLKGSIEAGLEWLRQTGAIKIEVTNFTGDADMKKKEEWALEFFTQKLLADWFEPSLTPGRLQGDSGTPTPTPTSGGGGGRPAPTSTTAPRPSPTPGPSPTSSSPRPTPAPTTTRPPTPPRADAGGGDVAGPPTPDTPNRARLNVITRQPDPSPNGLDVQHTPSTSGTQETVSVVGGRSPVLRVDGTDQAAGARSATLDVQPGTTHEIVVTDAAQPARADEFFLFFDFAKPDEAWTAGTPGNNAVYNSYLANTPSDTPVPPNVSTRFLTASTRGHEDPDPTKGGYPVPEPDSPPPVPGPQGADALAAWLQTLADPKQVSLTSHASFEGGSPDRPGQIAYNRRLSGRRDDVARGIIQANGVALTGNIVYDGEDTARNTGTHWDPKWRVGKIHGTVGASGNDASIRAQLTRGLVIKPPPPTPTGPTPTGPTPTRTTPTGPTPTGPTPTGPTPTGPTPTSSGTSGDPQVAFKLKFVHQDEQKTMVFEYHRQEAVQREYAPQGFIGLLLRDLTDREIHFVEVDLDDPFFRVFAVTIDAPIDYARLGLVSAHVAIDYGDAADEQNHKHADYIFDAQNHAQQKFQVFENATMDIRYNYLVEYHFDPESGWDGTKYTYQMPARRTDNRALLLNPFESMGFLEVRVFPQRIDPGMVTSTDVHLEFRQPDGRNPDPNATVSKKVISVTASSPPQFWRLRTDDPGARVYTYWFEHHLKDGTTRQTAPRTSDATAIAVDDPFDHSIEIEFIPLFAKGAMREVFIDIIYEDAANNYHRQERLTLPGTQTDAQLFRIALFNPALRTWRYRATYVTSASQLNRGDYVDTTETLIGLGG